MLIFCVTVAPYPIGEPMVAALEGTSITLSCTESKSLPPAKTVWLRGKNRTPIVPSSKYIVVEQGPNLSLTIVNATMDDQDVYFCWSENVVAFHALEVSLTIRCKRSWFFFFFYCFFKLIETYISGYSFNIAEMCITA